MDTFSGAFAAKGQNGSSGSRFFKKYSLDKANLVFLFHSLMTPQSDLQIGKLSFQHIRGVVNARLGYGRALKNGIDNPLAKLFVQRLRREIPCHFLGKQL